LKSIIRINRKRVVILVKALDLKATVHEIVTKELEALEVLKELGFTDIVKPGMLNTAGRFMTIPKGAALKGIDMDKIRQTFKAKGFEIIE
jgi:hypothetical protein